MIVSILPSHHGTHDHAQQLDHFMGNPSWPSRDSWRILASDLACSSRFFACGLFFGGFDGCELGFAGFDAFFCATRLSCGIVVIRQEHPVDHNDHHNNNDDKDAHNDYLRVQRHCR